MAYRCKGMTWNNPEETKESAKTSATQVLLVSIGATLISLIIGFLLSGTITKPFLLVMNQMKLIASGDLSDKPLII